MNPILALRPDDKQSTPLYLQLARSLEAAIHAGQWKSEQALPSERALSEQLSISRVTARKALEVLLAQGLIRRSQGSGTFITPRLEQPLSRLSGFSEMLRLKGFVPTSQWLERDITPPTHEELIRLGLSPTDKVARLKRLRKADDTVMAIEMTAMPASVLPHPRPSAIRCTNTWKASASPSCVPCSISRRSMPRRSSPRWSASPPAPPCC